MVRPENLHSKIAGLRRYLDLLDRLRVRPLVEIRADPFLVGALERYLFLAAQATIDLAEMFCILKGLGPVDSMSRSFGLLESAGIIPPDLAASMKKLVGFRNALVHGYENLDPDIVDDVVFQRLGELRQFAELIESRI